MAVVGADGCKAGWLAIRLEKDGWHTKVFPSIEDLWASWADASLILLDLPIGSTDDKEGRKCDGEARKLLGRRHVSVFTPPCRAALHVADFEEAKRVNKQVVGKSLSKQARGITDKIREVDDFLLEFAAARSKIREVHPEVCFWGFAKGKPITANKKTDQGRQERLRVLRKAYPNAQDVRNHALKQFPRQEVAEDDILDALAAAVTAMSSPDRLASIPSTPEYDARGLRMEMVHVRFDGEA